MSDTNIHVKIIERVTGQYKGHHLNYLKSLLEDFFRSKRKVAIHSWCTDGAVSAAIIMHQEKLSLEDILPLDYFVLRENEISEILSQGKWYMIIDLEPFSKKEFEVYVDHHGTTLGKKILAKKIIYDARAPSATSLVTSCLYKKDLPEYLKHLSLLTEITDTAGYKIPPPRDTSEDLGLKILQEKPDEFHLHEQAWLLEDAIKSATTYEELKERIKILSIHGIESLATNKTVIKKIQEFRKNRNQSIELAEKMPISDAVILVDHKDHLMIANMAYRLLERGSKIGIYITDENGKYKISFRVAKHLEPMEKERLRVDYIAKKLDGGGHPPAAGANTDDLEHALNIITSWLKEKGLKFKIHDLRTKKAL